MSDCPQLNAPLRQNPNPRGELAPDARPRGALITDPRPNASDFCRTYDFTFTPPALVALVTFDADAMVTFAGDELAAF